MVATNEGKNTNSRSQKRSRGRSGDRAAANGIGTAVAAATPAQRRSPAERRVPPAPEVGGRKAARRIRGLAALSDTLDIRNRLRRLGALVQGGGRDAQRMTFVRGCHLGGGVDGPHPPGWRLRGQPARATRALGALGDDQPRRR
jgi:hypothetical protein